MALEFENEIAVLGKFGESCEGSLLDWTRKCTDEVLWSIPMVLVSQHFDALPYRALVNSTTSINFRALWESEGGADAECCPSTVNNATEVCDFKLPELQFISIGVEPQCYWDWEKEFCKIYPRYSASSPFEVNGGQIALRPAEVESSQAFMSYISEALAQATWEHLYRTAWMGTDGKADSFNGLWHYLENGISPLDTTAGGCNYPLVPQKIDMGLYIHGTAAVAAGACAGPGDVVLEVGDANRPADAPADNVVTIYAGTSDETTVDITGMDVVDIMVVWLEFITNEWGVDVLSWFLGIPRNQYKCIAQVAACKQACSGGDCTSMYTADNRDLERADRESRMIATRMLNLYPYEETSIEVRQSDVLRQTKRLIFIPEVIRNGEGEEQYWMLWAWRNRAAESENFLGNVPQMRDQLGLEPGRLSEDFKGLVYDGEEFSTGQILDSVAWEWLSDRNCNSVRWWNNAQTGMVPQAPHLWLIIDNVCCDTVLTSTGASCGIVDDDGGLVNPNHWLISVCNDVAAPATYTSGLQFDISDNNLSGYAIGDEVDYLAFDGRTLRGTITAWAGASPTSVMTVGFMDTVLCADNGGGMSGYIRDAVG